MFEKILRRREPPHLYTLDIPRLLIKAVRLKNHEKFDLLDLGCGDGAKLFALKQRGLLKNAYSIVGVDISPERVGTVERKIEGVKGIVSDAYCVKELGENSFDIIICSSLIEHVENDLLLLKEIRRLLRLGGVVFFHTSLKKWYGFWLYRRNGKFVLAPEHVRDYPSKEELLNLVKSAGFRVIDYKVYPHRGFSLEDALVLLRHNFEWIGSSSFIENDQKRREALRKLRLPIKPIGFSLIDVLAEKYM